ncbi:MAG: hypothetical protein BWK73_44295 [Thiothrix lacustris]|uniref:Uncharacterized protein n=1 Tax=Thiothrix lacustris TaxID=525917 RepID=A0A1Y1QBS5_9GAMM|nr:MAG: hypothetical protein BWK73_44295 [Thiothrix lacustris]
MVAVVALCSSVANANVDLLTVQTKAKNTATELGIPLRSGQIVVTESSAPINLIYLLLYPEFSTFVHVGILDVTKEGSFVYDAGGTYKLGGGSNPPTDNVSGYVKRASFASFLEDVGGTVSIYDPPAGVDVSAVIAYAKQQTAQRTPFDAYFHYADHTRLYCAEFVAQALEAGGAHSHFLVAIKPNASMRVVLNWLKVKDEKILPVYQLLKVNNWVGTLSKTHTLTELEVDRAIKYALYQRFTPDQKLGNVLDWGALGVELQQPIVQFRQAAFALFDKHKLYAVADIAQKVNQLANIYLGVFDGENMSECAIDFSRC